MAQFLDRKGLLKKVQFPMEKVEFENGDFVYVREMSGREKDRYEMGLFKWVEDGEGGRRLERDTEDLRGKLAVSTLCDETGELLLAFEDYPKISKNMPASMLDKIVDAANRLNGLGEAAKKVILKNFVPGQSADSSSSSAGN